MSELMLASTWWGLHLLARQVGTPVWALMPQTAPIWAHSFLMLFTVLPTFFFGFLYTVFPRWMNGPPVPRRACLATALLFGGATVLWLVGLHTAPTLLVVAALAALAGLLVATSALTRVLLDAEQAVPHAYAVLIGLVVQLVALAGFTFGIGRGSDFALHFAVRTSLWGGLLPVFFAVCHRMIPFFSQGVARNYVAGLALYLLVGVLAWRDATWIIDHADAFDDLRWAARLAAMIQTSLAGFAVGGAFLSLAYFDLQYYLVVLLVAMRALVAQREAQPVLAKAPA